MLRVSARAISVPSGASSEFRTPQSGGIVSEIKVAIADLLKTIQVERKGQVRFVTQSEGDYEDLNAGIRHHVLISVYWDDGRPE